MTTIFTIGYEQATLADVIDRLAAAGVEQLLDVRAVAASRRPGFSKTVLSNSLAAAGIAYVHLRGLGTPADGRAAARAGRVDAMHAIFRAHMTTTEAQADLARAADLVATRPSALLCYEAAASVCHRRIVADTLVDMLGADVIDL